METQKSKRNLWIGLVVLLLIVLLLVFLFTREKPVSDTIVETAPVDTQTETPADNTTTPAVPQTKNSAADALNDGAVLTLKGLDIGMSSEAAEQRIISTLNPRTTVGGQSYAASRTPETEGGYTMIATGNNIANEKVAAMEVMAIFKPGETDRFVLGEYTLRVKCRKGGESATWQETAC